MKYYIWDNDNAVLVCSTNSRKEAFKAVLNHLIEANDSEVPDPIMWPGYTTEDMYINQEKALTLIQQATEAYERIAGIIPKS